MGIDPSRVRRINRADLEMKSNLREDARFYWVPLFPVKVMIWKNILLKMIHCITYKDERIK